MMGVGRVVGNVRRIVCIREAIQGPVPDQAGLLARETSVAVGFDVCGRARVIPKPHFCYSTMEKVTRGSEAIADACLGAHSQKAVANLPGAQGATVVSHCFHV